MRFFCCSRPSSNRFLDILMLICASFSSLLFLGFFLFLLFVIVYCVVGLQKGPPLLYSFSHPLTQLIAYQDLLPRQIRKVHRTIAMMLDSQRLAWITQMQQDKQMQFIEKLMQEQPNLAMLVDSNQFQSIALLLLHDPSRLVALLYHFCLARNKQKTEFYADVLKQLIRIKNVDVVALLRQSG